MGLPKISIVIPVYNVEPYIAECLQSVIRQTYQGPMECIIVDDCGTDKSIEIAEQIIAGYDGPVEFRLLSHKRNNGLSAGRNTGVASATGDYIFFLDSDDYISDDCLKMLTQPFKEREYDMVVGDLVTFGNPHDSQYLFGETRTVLGNERIFDELCCKEIIPVMAWNKLIRASLFRRYDLSFLEGQIHEDELWTYKTSLYLTSLFVLRVPTYFYRIREDGIMSDSLHDVEKRMKSRYDTINYALDYPAEVGKDLLNRNLIKKFEKYVRISFFDDIDFRRDFVELRRKYDNYRPGRIVGSLSFSEAKNYQYLLLPPTLAYVLLKVRSRWKRIKKQMCQTSSNYRYGRE